jgi:exosortase/archaeosortase family protein
MRRNCIKTLHLFARYLLVAVTAAGNFYVFRKILTGPTITATAAALRLFFDDVFIMSPYIFVHGVTTEITASCVAILAYYLLFVLIISTANVKPAKRLMALAVSFAILFILNVARMVLLVFIVHTPYFDTAHFLFEHLFFSVVVVAVWAGISFFMKIKTVPVYSDLKFLYGDWEKRKRTSRRLLR